MRKGETMLSQDLIVAPTQSRPPTLIEGSGSKARDRIEHFLRAAIDNDNTRRAYGRSLGSFFAFLEDGGKERVQDIGPLDVRDYPEAAKHRLTDARSSPTPLSGDRLVCLSSDGVLFNPWR